MSRPVIDDDDVQGTVRLIGPGREESLEPVAHDRLCFVCSGAVTLDSGELNTVLVEDEMHRIRKDRHLVVRNHGTEPAKLLLLELPPPRVEYVPAQLIADEQPMV